MPFSRRGEAKTKPQNAAYSSIHKDEARRLFKYLVLWNAPLHSGWYCSRALWETAEYCLFFLSASCVPLLIHCGFAARLCVSPPDPSRSFWQLLGEAICKACLHVRCKRTLKITVFPYILLKLLTDLQREAGIIKRKRLSWTAGCSLRCNIE